MKLPNRKKLIPILIALTILAIIAGVFWHFRGSGEKTKLTADISSRAGNDVKNNSSQLDLPNVPDLPAVASAEAGVSAQDQIAYQGETIPLLWTDDNTNENLIIKTDKKYYDGNGQTEVYLGITNTTEQDQKADIYFWFDNGQKKVESVERLNNVSSIMNNGKEKNHNTLYVIHNSFLINNSDVPNRKPVNGYTTGSKFQDTIPAGQINYYKAVIKYPANQKQSEFFIEAFGNLKSEILNHKSEIAYGHLDPYLAGGLVGYWSFNGPDISWTANAAYDRSSSYATGTIINMSTTTSPVMGLSGQALDFERDNIQVVSITDASQTGLDLTGSFTIAAWIKVESYPSATDATGIVSKWESGSKNYNLKLSNSSHALGFAVSSDGSAENSFYGATAINPGTWYHVLGRFQAGVRQSVYINGVEDAYDDTSIDASLYNGNATFRIGHQWTWSGTDRLFDGLIDEVRIYNRALSASEITDLYQSGAARFKTNVSQQGRSTGGLVGYWSFNGPDISWTANAAYDRSSSYATGTITNMSTTTSPVMGLSGQALNFDGVDDYVNVADNGNLNLIPNSFTVSAWVNVTGFIGGVSWPRILYKGTDATNGYCITSVGNGVNGFGFGVMTGGILYEAYSNTGKSTGTWYYLTTVWNGSTASIYINGVQESGADQGTFTFSWATDLQIGRRGDASRYFSGLIDEVRIYNRALSASEITDLYQYGAARLKINVSQQGKSTGGLVGYWSFNGPDISWTANAAYDRSGSYATGTITNMSTTTSPVMGISGQALKFDGVDDYVSTANANLSTNFPGKVAFSAATWSFWFKRGSDSNDEFDLLSMYSNGGAERSWNFSIYVDKLYINLLNSTETTIYTGALFNNTDWHYVGVVYDGSLADADKVKIYLDGGTTPVPYTETITYSSIQDSNEPFYIGRTGYSASQYFWNGLIDEVRIYNRALSQGEITDLYQYGAARVK